MSEVFIKRYDAAQKEKVIVDDLFEAFMDLIKADESKGHILTVTAKISSSDLLDTLFEGGGIGKTKVLEHMYDRYNFRSGKNMPIPVIDMFEETTTFLIWVKIMANLLSILNMDETAAEKTFPNSMAFLKRIKPDQDNIADDLSKKALKNFRRDIEVNGDVIHTEVKKSGLCILFMDSFEYVDKEIKNRLEAYKKNIIGNKENEGVNKARLKRFQHYNFSLFDELKNENGQGILDLLLKIGVSVVISGRLIEGFREEEVTTSCKVGLLEDREMEEYIKEIEKIDISSSNEPELFSRIKLLTQRRPILVYIFFQLARIQKEKDERKKIIDPHKSYLEVVREFAEKEAPHQNDFEKAIFSELYNKADSYLTSSVLYYMSVAEDGVSKKILADFCDLSEEDYDFKELINQLTKWAYTKKRSLVNNSLVLEGYIQTLLDNIGLQASENEYRLHDEMVDLIIKHHWSKDSREVFLERKKYLIHITKAYKSYYLTDYSNEEIRKKLREYLGYQLELAEVENLLRDVTKEQEIKYFENVVSEIAYRYISAIDEFPDHAERILNKANYFFDDKPFSTHKARILLLRIDHFLTISRFREAENDIKKFEEEFKNIDYHGKESQWESVRAVLFAHKAQLNIWQGKIRSESENSLTGDFVENISTTKEYLQKSSRLAYRTGSRATLAWTAHLWGWLFQRKGEFMESMNWHKKALNASLISSNELLEKRKEEPQQDFELYYQLRLLSKIIGRTLGNMVFTHKESGEIEESLFISNLLLFFLSKQKNDSREEVRALIGNFLSNISWGASLENTEKIARILEKIGDYEDENLQLSIANVNAVYKYRDIEINTYVNYYLPEEFEKEVRSLENKEKSKEAIARSKSVLEKHFEGLSTGKPKKVNLNYARASYQYGKSCLITLSDGKIEYENARVSFENAKSISKEIGYKYLELEAIEALFTLSYLAGNGETPETQQYRDEFKASFFSYLPEWEHQTESERIKWFDAKIRTFINLDDIFYKDVLTKFFTTEANIIFNSAILDKNYRDDSTTWDNWKKRILEAFGFYSNMLHYSYLHNENRYTLSLNILYSRLEKVVENKEKELAKVIKGKIVDQDSSYSIKDTDFIRFSNLLWEIIDLELTKTQLPVKNEEELNAKKNIESGIVKGIFDLDARGQFQKSLILARSLLNHRLYDFDLNYKEKESYRQEALVYMAEEIATGSFNLCFNLLLNNKSNEITTVVEKFAGNEKISGLLPPSQYSALKAGLNIMQLTSEYRNQEFWTIERFLEGELTFFREEKYNNQNVPGMMARFEKNLNKIIDYCLELENAGNIAQNEYRYLRLLSECCIRLGEFCMLSGQSFQEKTDEHGRSFTEKLEKLFEKLIDPANKLRHRWDNPRTQIDEHIVHFGERSAAFYLSYAYHLSKFTSIVTQDYRRTAYCLEAIGNVYYLEGKFQLKQGGIPATVKYLCLSDEARKEFDQATPVKRPYENDALKDKYIAEKDIRYPLILAYMKIVEGDYIYSQLFEIDPDSYAGNKNAAFKPQQLPQEKLKLPAFVLRKGLENNRPEDIRMEVRKMVLHYLKSLNMFAITPYRTFTYKNMVLELERRLLLVPDEDNILRNIEEDLTTIWLNFNNLKNREDSLQRLLTLLKVRRLCLALDNDRAQFVKQSSPGID